MPNTSSSVKELPYLVYLLEDSRTQRESLVADLDHGELVVHGFATMADLDVALAQATPSVVLADFHLQSRDDESAPWCTTLPLLTASARLRVPVVVMSGDMDSGDPGMRSALMKKGAREVVGKRDVAAIREVLIAVCRSREQ